MSSNLPARPRQVAQRRTFAIVASEYHRDLVQGLIDHAEQELAAISPQFQVFRQHVPGAFEIPLAVQEIARRSEVDAIIALGVIIEGETAHASMIATTITQSLQQISLAAVCPVIHEVLLVQNVEQARARCLDDEINRGTEAARVAVRMVQVMAEIRGQR